MNGMPYPQGYNYGIFITVRTGSTRLPKKALLEVSGFPSIQFLIRRVKTCKTTHRIVLCTTELKEDDVLADIAREEGIDCFRGSEKDKLARWLGAAEKYNVGFFITADGDDLLCDPELIDQAIWQVENTCLPLDLLEAPGIACGAFTYGIKTEALKKVCEIKNTDDTEMMWTYFKDTGLFKIGKLDYNPIFKSDARLTLDYEEDLEFFRTVIKEFDDHHFGKQGNWYGLRDILPWLEKHPEVKAINAHRQAEFLANQQKKTHLDLKPAALHPQNPSKYLGREYEYLGKVLLQESWSATGGSWTQNLERQFAEKFGAKYGIAMNSGTATLHCALEAAGVKAGDEVISPAITVIMDSTATLHANAIPVYADVNPKTFTIDPEDVARKITPKTKAIIAVSIYGLPCDMDPLMELAKKHNLALIEDNAQCFLSTYKGRMTGTIGHLSSYSFENTKHISCGEGGMVLTNDEKLAEMVRKIGGHGFKNLRAEEGRIRLNQSVFQNPNYKRHDVIGWNYRMPEFNAAVALAQLERLDELVEMRVKSAKIFTDVMKSCDFLIPQETPEGYTNSYYTLGVVYEGEKSIGVSWENFRAAYVEAGGDGIYGAWSVPYLEPVMAERTFAERCRPIYAPLGIAMSYREGLCPVAEAVQKKLMQFKTNYRDMELAEKKAGILLKTIKKLSGK